MEWPSELPIAQAPMAGGPSTPELTAAVSRAGGYGFVAAGYLTPDGLRLAITRTRELTPAPFGVNLFMSSVPGDRGAIERYASELQSETQRIGVALGEPAWDDDAFEEKVDVVETSPVDLVSFTFGCPSAAVVERLQRAGSRVAVTVTSVEEADVAALVGTDLLAVQGTEAGGHQGSFLSLEPNRRPLLELLRAIRSSSRLPLVASGGLMTGADLAAALGAGAMAAQLGTAFLCATEAGTAPTYRRALLEQTYAETVVTRAFSGRYARGLANEFALAHDGHAPAAYPEVHHLTRPLRAAAMQAGDPSVPNLWAGQGWRQVTSEAAGSIVQRIVSDARRV